MDWAGKKLRILSFLLIFLLPFLGAAEKKIPRRALILGDSHAYGLTDIAGSFLDGEDWVFDVKGVSSSGLARRDFFDWLAYGNSERSDGYDAYVIILGTNDGQNSRGLKDFRFGTLEWEYLYTARVEYLITALERKGELLWVSIPPVESEDLRRKTEYLQALIGEVCLKHGVNGLDTSSFLTDPNLRRDDGIHLTAEGDALLFERIREKVIQLFPY